ncbi:MAG: hypothetical protein AABX55_01185 [Nanoarchaeota archaeon]
MINELLILGYILLIFVSIAFWEAYIEGKNGWASKSVGWRMKKNLIFIKGITAYHFWSWIIMIPMFLALPLIIYGFDLKIFGILATGYFWGAILQDFLWFVVNPVFPFKDFNSKKVKWHRWFKIGKFEIPQGYIVYFLLGLIIWKLLVV